MYYRQLNRRPLRLQPPLLPVDLMKGISFAPRHDIMAAFSQMDIDCLSTESQYFDDDVVVMSSECSKYVASSPRLEDSDQLLFQF